MEKVAFSDSPKIVGKWVTKNVHTNFVREGDPSVKI